MKSRLSVSLRNASILLSFVNAASIRAEGLSEQSTILVCALGQQEGNMNNGIVERGGASPYLFSIIGLFTKFLFIISNFCAISTRIP